jgi:hypothetical protein
MMEETRTLVAYRLERFVEAVSEIAKKEMTTS